MDDFAFEIINLQCFYWGAWSIGFCIILNDHTTSYHLKEKNLMWWVHIQKNVFKNVISQKYMEAQDKGEMTNFKNINKKLKFVGFF
jgi:hypothetical protein